MESVEGGAADQDAYAKCGRVATTDGVVTLSGTARNAAEKSLVTKLVTGINGVESVINNMTIEAAVSGTISRPLPPQNLKVVIK